MADRIDAHITILHDTARAESFRERLEPIAEMTAPITLRLTSAACWQGPEGGIYLGVDDKHGAIASIREMLRVTDSPGVTYAPHVTLVHPRTTPAERARAAWTSLANWSIEQVVRIDKLSVIEFDGSRWQPSSVVNLSGRNS